MSRAGDNHHFYADPANQVPVDPTPHRRRKARTGSRDGVQSSPGELGKETVRVRRTEPRELREL